MRNEEKELEKGNDLKSLRTGYHLSERNERYIEAHRPTIDPHRGIIDKRPSLRSLFTKPALEYLMIRGKEEEDKTNKEKSQRRFE